MNILLIEDEQEVASFIKKGLEEQHFNVTVTYNGNPGLGLALSQVFDIIILDVMLPDINGWEICKVLRNAGIQTPIIILTALGGITDKIKGLEYGADDYITKPFHFDEFLARIKALLRRQKNMESEKTYTAGDLVMNCSKRTVTLGNKKIVLTSKEFQLLEVLMANKNRILSRNEISKLVWGTGFPKGSNVVDVYINFLRSKIDKDTDKKLIQTVIGMGYIIRG